MGFRLLFGTLMRRFGRDDPLEFIDTLEHELTHALVGYATLCPPVSLSASLKAGGEVELRGSNPLAALAPYFLPLWTLLALLMGLVVKPCMQTAWNHLIFFLLGMLLLPPFAGIPMAPDRPACIRLRLFHLERIHPAAAQPGPDPSCARAAARRLARLRRPARLANRSSGLGLGPLPYRGEFPSPALGRNRAR